MKWEKWRTQGWDHKTDGGLVDENEEVDYGQIMDGLTSQAKEHQFCPWEQAGAFVGGVIWSLHFQNIF